MLAGVCIVFVVTGAVLMRWRVRDVVVEGATFVPAVVIRDATLSALSERRWGIHPRSRMALVNTRALRRSLTAQFALAAVTVERRFDGILRVTVREQELSGVVRFDGAGVLLGADGRVVGTVSAAALPPYLGTAARPFTAPVVIGEGAVPPMGQLAVEAATLRLMRALWIELQRSGSEFSPRTTMRREGSPKTIDITTWNGATITATTEESTDRQLGKLRAVLHDRSVVPSAAPIRSIDLRYGDRVYVQ